MVMLSLIFCSKYFSSKLYLTSAQTMQKQLCHYDSRGDSRSCFFKGGETLLSAFIFRPFSTILKYMRDLTELETKKKLAPRLAFKMYGFQVRDNGFRKAGADSSPDVSTRSGC